jgi:formate hydrogenlyase transcriptional activator
MSVDLIGASQAMKSVLEAIAMVARVDSTVLIRGETGTGKELVARAIHQASPRRAERFVAVNCAAIPAPLLESELFGHERGAFTGAVTQTTGRFQAADRGTLFLDEIGDLPLELQPKLLRALQELQIERLGNSGHPVPVDVRVVAATNQDLWNMVHRGTFRADLYYRLNVFPIAVPPLRERREDIPPLVRHFVRRFAKRQGKVIDHVSEEVMDALEGQRWPGNVRELQNAVERAVIATNGGALEPPDLEPGRPEPASPARTLAQMERDHILATLRETNWVVGGWNGAAARLGVSRTTLIAKMQRLGLSRGRTAVRQPPASSGTPTSPSPLSAVRGG